MRAGKLRHLIDIEEDQQTERDTVRQKLPRNWIAIHEDVYALVEIEDGAETVGNKQVQAGTRYKVTTRYISGINSQHRIRWEGKTLNITSIDPDPRKFQMVIKAAENGNSS